MKIQIRLGGNPSAKIVTITNEYQDELRKEIDVVEMMLSEDNVTIDEASIFFLGVLQNMVTRYLIRNQVGVPDEVKNREMLDPKTIEVVQIDNEGNETSIQNEEGLIDENYFNEFMGEIYNDFYKVLPFYQTEG